MQLSCAEGMKAMAMLPCCFTADSTEGDEPLTQISHFVYKTIYLGCTNLAGVHGSNTLSDLHCSFLVF
jgi:hypothetical protein